MESIIPFSCQALCFVEPEACVIHLHCPSDVSFCVIGRATILAFSVEYLVQRCLTLPVVWLLHLTYASKISLIVKFLGYRNQIFNTI